ncbi:hypothetical protein [Bradyrhizobium genosp. A]|uniref:hypothetical protein n=1 Tax=Bradyrhizobium genosp. A TaxID=83626 RepID=UPI003CF12BB8
MQKAPPEAELSLHGSSVNQWPKNSHSRMITGIGTPNSHNKIPRPIASSSIHVVEERTQGARARSNGAALPVASLTSDKPYQ